MEKMWAGRSLGATEKIADELNSSIGFDARLYKEDITGSIAHAKMLSKQGIITEEEKDQIVEGLGKILSGIDDGSIKIDPTAEDIHMFVESVLTEMIGEAGKKVHTARSRNDQVALDMRLYLREQCDTAVSLIKDVIAAVCSKAEEYKECIMPGYTHLQRAQPILFSHEILTYAHMLERDIDRFTETKKRMDVSPIGCCALAGTTYDTDREYEAELLGFPHIALNSLDGVSDRDFCCDFIYDCAMLMMHLSRFSEELILFSSWEFGFIELPEAFTTGSSIMPQKKNPDMAELTRGKTGRVYGDLMGLLTTLKGIPLAYNKDMQEDKEAVFDALDNAFLCLKIFAPMVAGIKAKPEVMLSAAKKGFINATDLADYMVGRGIAFRDAYHISGRLVHDCIEKGIVLEDVSIEDYKKYSPLIGEDVYEAIDLTNCVQKRLSAGGTSVESVETQLDHFRRILS